MTKKQLHERQRISEIFGLLFYSLGKLLDTPEETKLEAIKRNYKSIQYMLDPNEKLQIAAISQNVDAINYITYPSESAKVLVKLLS